MLACLQRVGWRGDSEDVMDATIENNSSGDLIPIELIESCLELSGWEFQRDDDDNSIQCIAQSRWGDMGAMFSVRHEPPAVHFSVTLDVKPKAARKARVSELVMMANERLWLGHFDYWIDESVIMFRHTIPLLDRGAPTIGEVRAVMAAALDAVNTFVPAFNFVIWAGKSPAEALEGALFETAGEA